MYSLRAFFVIVAGCALIGLGSGCPLDPVPGGTGGSATSSTSTTVTSVGSGGSTGTTSTGTGGSGGIGGQGVGGSLPVCDPIKEKLCGGVCVSTEDPEHSCSMAGVCEPCKLANVDFRLCDKDEGTCAYGACLAGYLDCDNNAPNGCETLSNELHCSDCATPCQDQEACVIDSAEGTAACQLKK